MNEIIISKWHNLFFLIFIIPLLLFIFFSRLYHWKKILLPILRALIQLALLVFILEAVFDADSILWTLVSWFLMVLVGALHSAGIFWALEKDFQFGKFIQKIIFSFSALLVSSSIPLLLWYFLIFEFKNSPGGFHHSAWLALGGMAIHASLASIIISGETFIAELNAQRNKIESALALGLSFYQSFHWLIKNSLASVLNPLLSIFAAMGLGSIPFFMGAQLLDGQKSSVILNGQIAILGGIFIAAVLGALLIIVIFYNYYYKSFLPEKMAKGKFRKKRKIKIR